MKIIEFKTIDSTNSYLKINYQDFNHFTWVRSELQTKGRGRINNKWFGNQESLMCSTILKKDINPSNIGLYPLLAAQSLHKVLFKYHKSLKIKWPNDIYLHDKKIAGILTESIIESNKVLALVMGFGVNLNQKEFTNDLKDIATSLYMNTKQIYDKTSILKQLANQLESDLKQHIQDPLQTIKYCNDFNYLKGLDITFKDNLNSYSGKALDINQYGELRVETKDEVKTLSNGEVTLKIK